MAHKSGSNKALKIVVEEVSKDGYGTIIFDRQPIKWIEILTELGETLFEGKQDSKELSPRSLDKMLLKRQVNSQNVQSTQLSKFFKFSKSSKFFKLYCMIFKHV